MCWSRRIGRGRGGLCVHTKIHHSVTFPDIEVSFVDNVGAVVAAIVIIVSGWVGWWVGDLVRKWSSDLVG